MNLLKMYSMPLSRLLIKTTKEYQPWYQPPAYITYHWLVFGLWTTDTTTQSYCPFESSSAVSFHPCSCLFQFVTSHIGYKDSKGHFWKLGWRLGSETTLSYNHCSVLSHKASHFTLGHNQAGHGQLVPSKSSSADTHHFLSFRCSGLNWAL